LRHETHHTLGLYQIILASPPHQPTAGLGQVR
jgi:hypothetical protein